MSISIKNRCKLMLDNGDSIDKIISFLKSINHSPKGSIDIVSELMGISTASAKKIVLFSPGWEDYRKELDSLHGSLYDAMKNIESDSQKS